MLTTVRPSIPYDLHVYTFMYLIQGIILMAPNDNDLTDISLDLRLRINCDSIKLNTKLDM